MSDDPKSPSELIAAIRRDDRRYRRASHVFFGVIILVLCGVILGQYYQQQQFKGQSAERQVGLAKILKAQQEEQAKQTRYIQCISQFFATANRTNLILTDLDKCNYQQNGTPVPGVDLTPTGTQSVTFLTNPLPTGGSTTTTTTSSSVAGTQGSQQTGTVDNSVLPANPIVNVQPATPLTVTLPVVPRNVLTVDSCVPVLQICLAN